tara:strand:+ start:723 stop:1241 length:519 start_codon:yes stop_codon:yes gene_type:complete
MKTFKQLTLLFSISLFICSCNTDERSVGMNTWDGLDDLKFHIGTEDPIQTVMEFENADKADDYDKMKSMMTDSTTFTGGNGITRGVDEWLELKKSRKSRFDSIGATVSWKTTSIFSVDIAPGEGGELVHNYIDAKYTEGDQVNEWRSMGLWYIVDGKVIWVNSYYQDIRKEE